jgi:anti-sigma factor RsiW
MTHDQLEFSINQYLDGTLPENERAALEALIANDAEAQALVAEDRSLTALLQSQSLPDVQWDRFAESVSAAIDAQLEERVDRASQWLRMRLPTGMAIAACALLAIGLGIHLLSQSSQPAGPTSITSSQGRQVATAIISVEGPQSDAPNGPVVSQISIEAGGSYAKDSSLSPYADEMDNRPSRVVIASGLNTEQSRSSFPY